MTGRLGLRLLLALLLFKLRPSRGKIEQHSPLSNSPNHRHLASPRSSPLANGFPGAHLPLPKSPAPLTFLHSVATFYSIDSIDRIAFTNSFGLVSISRQSVFRLRHLASSGTPSPRKPLPASFRLLQLRHLDPSSGSSRKLNGSYQDKL